MARRTVVARNNAAWTAQVVTYAATLSAGESDIRAKEDEVGAVIFGLYNGPTLNETHFTFSIAKGDRLRGGRGVIAAYRSSGRSPVIFATRASMRGPISSPSWNAKT